MQRLRTENNHEAGIRVQVQRGGSLTVMDSCIRGNGLSPGDPQNPASGMSLNGITQLGVSSPPGSSNFVTVIRSEIVQNMSGGADIRASSLVPDMRQNWWGAANGPSGTGRSGSGDSVTAGITVDPFATTPFGACN
jgi:hypothetical protein